MRTEKVVVVDQHVVAQWLRIEPLSKLEMQYNNNNKYKKTQKVHHKK